MSKLKVTQVRSVIDRPKDQKDTVRRLGLHRINDTVVKDDRPEIRGMIAKVAHLVEVRGGRRDEAASPEARRGRHEGRKRVGRGRAGGGGKTAGRGTKGTGARKNDPLGFEGGQMPLQRRVPKLRVHEPQPRGVRRRERRGRSRSTSTARSPRGAARARDGPQGPQGQGARPRRAHKALTVKAHAFSRRPRRPRSSRPEAAPSWSADRGRKGRPCSAPSSTRSRSRISATRSCSRWSSSPCTGSARTFRSR